MLTYGVTEVLEAIEDGYHGFVEGHEGNAISLGLKSEICLWPRRWACQSDLLPRLERYRLFSSSLKLIPAGLLNHLPKRLLLWKADRQRNTMLRRGEE